MGPVQTLLRAQEAQEGCAPPGGWRAVICAPIPPSPPCTRQRPLAIPDLPIAHAARSPCMQLTSPTFSVTAASTRPWHQSSMPPMRHTHLPPGHSSSSSIQGAQPMVGRAQEAENTSTLLWLLIRSSAVDGGSRWCCCHGWLTCLVDGLCHVHHCNLCPGMLRILLTLLCLLRLCCVPPLERPPPPFLQPTS